MTETTGIVTMESPIMGPRLSGSTGRLIPGVEAQIVSVDTNKPLPINEMGEIRVRGPTIMQGMLILSFLTHKARIFNLFL